MAQSTRNIDDVLKRWHMTELRPLQREAIDAAVRGRDSLVVMPTGGGKSLCYQAPSMIRPDLTVVISPLIALMQDQVGRAPDGLLAAAIHSGMYAEQQREVEEAVRDGRLDLLYVAPERFAGPRLMALLMDAGVSAFVIDEAHCITQWGHDFRPDYARLGRLRDQFPKASMHAFTATARPRVRDKIVASLELREPAVLVGDFNRPNLHLSVQRRDNIERQLIECERRHQAEAGIVYAIRRADTVYYADVLRKAGVCAAAYHAGMDAYDRTRVQDAFHRGTLDVVVATVAYGMGIDHPHVRYIVHAAMPSSIEQYHQEIGRAGRDGDPAECVMFWSRQDMDVWRSVIWRDGNAIRPDAVGEIARAEALEAIDDYATSSECRHQALVDYFGGHDLDDCHRRDNLNCHNCDNCAGTPSPTNSEHNCAGTPSPTNSEPRASALAGLSGAMTQFTDAARAARAARQKRAEGFSPRGAVGSDDTIFADAARQKRAEGFSPRGRANDD